MFYTWEASRCPHTFGYPLTPPICLNTPMSPMLPCASACSGGTCMLLGDVGPSCLDTPMCLDACSCVQHPHAFICSPACLYCRVIACTMGGTFHMLGAGGFSTSVRLLVSVSTSIGCPLCFILYLSCNLLCLKSLLPLLQPLLFQ